MCLESSWEGRGRSVARAATKSYVMFTFLAALQSYFWTEGALGVHSQTDKCSTAAQTRARGPGLLANRR